DDQLFSDQKPRIPNPFDDFIGFPWPCEDGRDLNRNTGCIIPTFNGRVVHHITHYRTIVLNSPKIGHNAIKF
ncbi:MAG: hypothetical protein EBW83_11140, partial [Rhodobacterales bacterium]|nr:hypothetical protein [Rhodobacterales bacterium]